MFGEIVVVALEQRGLVFFDKVDFAPDFQRLAGREAPEPEVAVQAADDALKQFLIRLERGGEDHRAVAAEAADQPVAWHVGMQRARVDVGARHARPGPNLAGDVAGLGRPALRRHHRPSPVEVDEALFDVGVLVGGGVRAGAGEFPDADAWLRPVRLGSPGRGIVRGEQKIDLVVRGGDDVLDRHAVVHVAMQPNLRAVSAAGDEARLVADDGVLPPVGRLRIVTAICLEVMDFHLLAGEMITTDRQVIFGPIQRQLGRLGRLAKRHRARDGKNGKKRFHDRSAEASARGSAVSTAMHLALGPTFGEYSVAHGRTDPRPAA